MWKGWPRLGIDLKVHAKSNIPSCASPLIRRASLLGMNICMCRGCCRNAVPRVKWSPSGNNASGHCYFPAGSCIIYVVLHILTNHVLWDIYIGNAETGNNSGEKVTAVALRHSNKWKWKYTFSTRETYLCWKSYMTKKSLKICWKY